MTRERLRPSVLARRILLPPLLAGMAVAGLLVVLAASASQGAKASNPLGGTTHLVTQLEGDLEGTPTAADIVHARRPRSERKRLLAAHPYYALYRMAKRQFDVPWLLVASVHYQETGFGRAPGRLAHSPAWYRHKRAAERVARPAIYPHRSARHPSIKDDFDVVMSIGGELRSAHARDLGESARKALAIRYGNDPRGRLSAAMVLERARAWKLLGSIPLPGRGELATPVRGVVPGCGYFGCPRPGHLHNGLDLLAPTGTPVHAADSGTVAVLESIGESGGYGNFLCLQHRPHLATCYAHLGAVAEGMQIGAQVKRGDVIGLVGSTGSSSAPHLHFEVRRGPAACGSCAIDPAPLLDGEVPASIVPEMVALGASTGASGVPGPGPVAPNTGSSVEDGGAPAEHAEPAHVLRAPNLRTPHRLDPIPAATTPQPAPAPTTPPVPEQPATTPEPPFAAPEAPPAAPDPAPAPPPEAPQPDVPAPPQTAPSARR